MNTNRFLTIAAIIVCMLKPLYAQHTLLTKELNMARPDGDKVYYPEIMDDYEFKQKNIHFLFIDETVFKNEAIDKIVRDSLWYKHIIIHSKSELRSINNTIILK